MIVLAIDTSGPVAGVALTQEGVVRYEAAAVNKFTHSQSLMPMVEEAFLRTGLTLADAGLLCAVSGPGSFTGVRIGVSAVKAMAHATGKPCIGVNALHALAAGVCLDGGLICPIQDARAGQVYGAAFAGGMPPVRRLPDTAAKLAEYLALIAPLGGDPLFVGDGVPVYRAAIEQALGGRARFAPAHLRYLRASAAALLAGENAAQAGDYLSLQPLYLRAPQAERERLARERAHG